MSKKSTPRSSKKAKIDEQKVEDTPSKLQMTFSSDDEIESIQDVEKLRAYKPSLIDIPEEDAEALIMRGKYAKTSHLIGNRTHDAQNFGFQTPKKSNQMLERTAQILQNSASKLPPSPLAAKNATPRSGRKCGRTSLSATPTKAISTPNKAPGTPSSLRKTAILNVNTPLRGLQLSGDDPATPIGTRRILKQKIEKLKADEESSDESSSDEEDSDDESDVENSPIKKVMTPAKETPLKGRKKLVAKEQPENYFQAHGDSKILTSDKTLSSLKTPRLSQEALRHMLSGEKLKFQPQMEKLMSNYRSAFSKWMLLLCENFNLILYGLGSKRNLLNDFHSQMFPDSDFIVVNGFFPSVTVKQILNGITVDILETEATFATPTEQIEFINKNLREPLFILIHNIDGSMLRGEKNQSVIARLAAHPKIHLICTIDHINAPLMWDQQKLSQFNFAWFDCTTFMPYTEETLNENSLMVKQSGSLALNSLNRVFASLTPNAKGIYMHIVKYQMEGVQESGTQFYPGISFKDLYRICRKAFLVNADLTLRAQLTEFRDHKLIKSRKGNDGLEYLIIPLDNNTLQEFVEQQGASEKS